MINKAQQLAEKLKQYIPNGDGYNSEFANDLAKVVEYLSQDEQEPVAWGEPNAIGDVIDVITDDDRSRDVTQWSKSYTIPLYARPPKRQPLSDEYIERVILNWDDVDEDMDLVEFARVIEKAHGISDEC